MDISRRSFLGGSLALGAFSGLRAFSAPAGSFLGGGARLKFGVVSDLHIDCGRGDFKKFGDAAQFERTLRWFDAQGVDGVVVAGDMADNGMINQLKCVGEAWFRVFPDGKSASGRPVEQLFVYGNHDFEGQHYDKFDFRYFEKKSFEAQWIRRHPAKAWQLSFHEDYSPIWLKNVKGYQFIGAHWSLEKNAWDGIPAVEAWFKANAAKIDRSKPFFYIQHCHPKDTVYGTDAWSPDKGYATRALTPFPNAVAFSGHSHTTLTDERSIWQGAFTSVGTSSLRYGGAVNNWEQRQGMLATVYDDRIVLSRRDFLHDEPLGDDWVIPLDASIRPYAFATRKAKVAPPEFAADAKLDVKREKNGWLLTIPCASAAKARAYRYEIETGLKTPKGAPAVFKTWDATYNLPAKMSGASTKYLVKDSQFAQPAAGEQAAPLKPAFVVTPLDSYGNRGRSLKATV